MMKLLTSGNYYGSIPDNLFILPCVQMSTTLHGTFAEGETRKRRWRRGFQGSQRKRSTSSERSESPRDLILYYVHPTIMDERPPPGRPDRPYYTRMPVPYDYAWKAKPSIVGAWLAP